MQNNIINIEKECMLMNGKMNMSISQIFQKDGKPTLRTVSEAEKVPRVNSGLHDYFQ